jgi:hypothetical protein
MAQTNYNTNAITSRIIVLNNAKFAAGTYKRGQLVGMTTATGVFATYNASGTGGIEQITAVVLNDVTIDSTNTTAAVARGEFNRDGVAAVMASLTAPVMLTDAIVGQCWDAGIILN